MGQGNQFFPRNRLPTFFIFLTWPQVSVLQFEFHYFFLFKSLSFTTAHCVCESRLHNWIFTKDISWSEKIKIRLFFFFFPEIGRCVCGWGVNPAVSFGACAPRERERDWLYGRERLYWSSYTGHGRRDGLWTQPNSRPCTDFSPGWQLHKVGGGLGWLEVFFFRRSKRSCAVQ
jgi:hypothetical protein